MYRLEYRHHPDAEWIVQTPADPIALLLVFPCVEFPEYLRFHPFLCSSNFSWIFTYLPDLLFVNCAAFIPFLEGCPLSELAFNKAVVYKCSSRVISP
jgi:hypothetical protein